MSDIEAEGADDPVILAGEYALGVLEGNDLAAAHQRYLVDGSFAHAVEWWQYRLGQLSDGANVAVLSDRVWPAIEARLAAQRALDPLPHSRKDRTGLAGWSLAGALAASAAVAAALVLWLYNPVRSTVPIAPHKQQQPQLPQPQSAEPTQSHELGPQLIVQARDESGRQLVSRIIPDRQKLIGRVEGLTPDDPKLQSAELWVVPANGQPLSLGLIPAEGNFSRDLNAREAGLLTEGATLAVTIEDRASAPHDAPSTPILVSAPLAKL